MPKPKSKTTRGNGHGSDLATLPPAEIEEDAPKQIVATHTRPRDEKQLSRQAEAYRLHVLDRMPIRQTATALGITQGTALSDVRYEAERLAAERRELREMDKEIHLTQLDDLYRNAMDLAAKPGTGALGTAAKAQEMRAKILGLEAAQKVEVSTQRQIIVRIVDSPKRVN